MGMEFLGTNEMRKLYDAANKLHGRKNFFDLETADPGAQFMVVILCLPLVYSFMLWLGRWLKRRHGVQLRWPYHLFAAFLAVYGPAKMLGIHFLYRRELGALTC